MRRALLLGLIAMCGCGFALAQVSIYPPLPPDMAGYARSADMPAPATASPPATALDGAQGASAQYARADHTHAARVQRTVLTTAADGTATWTYARPIIVPAGRLPPVAYMVEDTGSPVVVQITGRTMTTDGTTDTHAAVTIRAQRSRTLPATILTLAALLNFDLFGGSASGTKVNVWAADPTQ